MYVDLDQAQTKAIGELESGKILKGGVGSGKSRTAVAYFYTRVVGGSLDHGNSVPLSEPVDLYIITTAKKRDSGEWINEYLPFGFSSERENSVGGVRVIVDSWNNIANYREVKDAFFIFDEQRIVGSGAWAKSFLRIARSNRWIVLTATPGDVWMDYASIFVANGFYTNKSEFVRNHVVYSPYAKFPKVDRYIDTGTLERYRRRITVDMPVKRHTRRHLEYILVGHDEKRMERVFKERWHIFEERPIRGIAELFLVLRRVANSDPSRLEAVVELQKKHPRLIVFYNFNYELEALRTLGPRLGIDVAEWNGQKHEEVPTSGSWLYLVQYTAGAEGWNCTSTDATVFYSLNYSYKINEQAKGRIDRRDTPYTDLYYYIMRSKAMIDKAILRSIEQKENFNEKQFAQEIHVV